MVFTQGTNVWPMPSKILQRLLESRLYSCRYVSGEGYVVHLVPKLVCSRRHVELATRLVLGKEIWPKLAGTCFNNVSSIYS